MPSSRRERLFERLGWHPWFLLRRFERSSFRVAGAGGSLRAWLARHRGRGAPLWTISTYERVEPCRRLVDSLARAAEAAGVEPVVLVIRDAGPADYAPVRDALARGFGERGLLVEARRRLAKRERWRVFQLVMDVARTLSPPHHLSLEDDVELAPGWYDEMTSIVAGLGDPDLAVLYLVTADDDEPDGRWVEFAREPAPDGRSRKTQWFDGQAYLALPRFFEALAWRVIPVDPSRWDEDPTKSSGVARQLTRRLFTRAANVHQVTRSLAYHGSEPSLMNPEARAERPLDNRPDARRAAGSAPGE